MSEEELSQKTESESARVVEHLFRHESGRLTAILTRTFGLAHLDLVEDAVQETLLKALRSWPLRGVPDNPQAWLLQTAKNAALDVLRRKQSFSLKQTDVVSHWEQMTGMPEESAAFRLELKDDLLRMMFACCHPSIPQSAQVALVLKELCGFSVREISLAFLAEEAAIAQRIVRAKRQFHDCSVSLEITREDVAERLDSVLQVIYLLFNEGYDRHSGNELVSTDIAFEAIRLGELVAEHPLTDVLEAHALLALLYLQASRFAARVSTDGDLLVMAEQDRSKWDRELIAKGFRELDKAADGRELTRYHIEAGIASVHAAARHYKDTDWRQLMQLYDELYRIDRSPIVAINRAVIVLETEGPKAALARLFELERGAAVADYHLLHAVKAECNMRLQQFDSAREEYELALGLAGNEAERRFLRAKIAKCRAAMSREFN